MKYRRFLGLCTLTLAILIASHVLMLNLGPPPWLMEVEVLAFSVAALLYGFGLWSPARWLRPLWCQPIRGTVLITLGIMAMWVPTHFMISAYLIGFGLKLLWETACALERTQASEVAALADSFASAPPEWAVEDGTHAGGAHSDADRLPVRARRSIIGGAPHP